jgi:hypothetical protein
MPDQEWLTAKGFSLGVAAGIKLAINVTSDSAITRASTRRWTENAMNHMAMYDAPTLDAALSLAREQLPMLTR